MYIYIYVGMYVYMYTYVCEYVCVCTKKQITRSWCGLLVIGKYYLGNKQNERSIKKCYKIILPNCIN